MKRYHSGKTILHYDKAVEPACGLPGFAGVLMMYEEEIIAAWKPSSTQRVYFAAYENIIFPHLPAIPLRDYTRNTFETLFEDIERAGIEANTPYSHQSLTRFCHLCRMVTMAAERHGLCRDVLRPEEKTPVKQEKAAAKKNGARMRKSLTVKEEKALTALLMNDCTEAGEKIGLAIMFCLGLRPQEVAALNFSHLYQTHSESFMTLSVVNSTKAGKTEIKTGGKTSNAPRLLPVPDLLAQLLLARREYLRALMENGKIDDEKVRSVNDLPIACKALDFSERCDRDKLNQAAKKAFSEIHLDDEILEEIALEIEERQAQSVFEEKEPTSYLFRKNFATHMVILDLEEDEIHYLMGHELTGTGDVKARLTNPDALQRLSDKMRKRPLVNHLDRPEAIRISPWESVDGMTDHDTVWEISANDSTIGLVELSAEVKEPLTVIVRNDEGEERLGSALFVPKSSAGPEKVSEMKMYYKMYGLQRQWPSAAEVDAEA